MKTTAPKKRSPSWRQLPCPMCDAMKSIKEFVNGYPLGKEDNSRYIHTGCLAENFSQFELRCEECGWEGGKSEVRELKKQPVILTDRFMEALNYANHHHAGQTRKSTNIAYISHPIGVAGLILEAGGDEDQAIAGLLHDVPEDCGGEPRVAEILEMFGPRVAEIVRGCSDALPLKGEAKKPSKERKEDHLLELSHANYDVLIVTAADKTHNARAIRTDLETIGSLVWKRFNAPREDIIRYYESVHWILRQGKVNYCLLAQLRVAIEMMKIDPQ